jgi:hypothetical protein
MYPSKRKSITALILKGLLIGIIAIAIGFYAGHLLDKERRSEAMNRKECINEQSKAFTGTIRSIDRYEWNQHMNDEYFGLSIEVGGRSSVNYMFPREDHKELAGFAEPNDKVIKQAGKDSFIVMKEDGLARHFIVPVCLED